MYSLLTGKAIPASGPGPGPGPGPEFNDEEPFTSADHLAAMRRLLHAVDVRLHRCGTNQPDPERDLWLLAARLHVEAAKSAPTASQTDPLAEALKTAPPARTVPRDGDAL